MLLTNLSHYNYECAYRHAKSAQEWAKAQVTINYQGGSFHEPELNKRPIKKNGVTEAMIKAQDAYFRR